MWHYLEQLQSLLARLKLQETNHNILVDTDEGLEENMSNLNLKEEFNDE